MLVNFTVENYRSIKDAITLDMQSLGQVSELKENVFDVDRYKLLKSVVLYGANSSGKSNLIKAFGFFRHFVFSSTRLSENTKIDNLIPFLLGEKTKSTSNFEIEILVDSGKYRYGYELSHENVVGEWLYHTAKASEKPLFIREGDIIEMKPKFKEGKGLEEKTNEKALFLTVCAEFNGTIAKRVTSELRDINIISGLDDRGYRNFTADYIKDKQQHDLVIQALEQANLDITAIKEVKVEDEAFDSNGKSSERFMLFMEHKRFTDSGEECGNYELPINWESMGTQKYFHLLGPIHDTLRDGKTIIIDELDSRLHPKLTLNIIRMFHDPVINPKGAQLIFATHDTNLLSNKLFRRDQIYFTEKTYGSATDLYSLAEFKFDDGGKVRKDASYEKDYLNGRYGAVPFLGSFEFMNQFNDQENAD